MNYSIGLDIGSVSAKLVLINEDRSVVMVDAERVASSPYDAVASLISRLASRYDLAQINRAGVSGSGRGVIPRDLNWSVFSSSLAIASGVLHHHPDTRTIIQIGGQTSLVIELEVIKT